MKGSSPERPEVFERFAAVRSMRANAARAQANIVEIKNILTEFEMICQRLYLNTDKHPQLQSRMVKLREGLNRLEIETFFGLEVPQFVEAAWEELNR